MKNASAFRKQVARQPILFCRNANFRTLFVLFVSTLSIIDSAEINLERPHHRSCSQQLPRVQNLQHPHLI